jgi:hypothetical protein
MTPQPTARPWPYEPEDRRTSGGGGGIKLETVKFIGGMLLAALVSYFGTTYGMQERMSLLEQRMGYLQQTIDEMRVELKAMRPPVRWGVPSP